MMKNKGIDMKKIFLAVIFFLMACNSSENFKTGTYKMINSPNDASIILSFNDDGTINAKVVNIIMGNYKIEGNNLTIMPGGTTMMMGPEKEMEAEQIFIQMLPEVKSFEMKNNQLELISSDKRFIFESIGE